MEKREPLFTVGENVNWLQLLCKTFSKFSSVQFSYSVVSDSLRPHESQHARPPCPSPTSGVHWDSRPSSQWCRPATSSSVAPFSFGMIQQSHYWKKQNQSLQEVPTTIFSIVLCTVASIWKPPNYLPVDEWDWKMWCI